MVRRRSRHAGLLQVLLALAVGAQGARGTPSVAVLTVHKPVDMQANYPGYFATFSAWPLPRGDLAVMAPPDELGCEKYPENWPPATGGLGPAPGWMAVVSRGTCTFVHKAQMAEQAGAKGIIIVSNNQTVQIMGGGNTSDEKVGIFTLGVDKLLGERFRNASVAASQGEKEPLMMSVSGYEASLLNISELILILIAATLVALGAFFSTADLDVHPPGSFSTALAAPEEEVLEVDQWLAVGFCAVGSGFLVFLFFFMQYMIYFIIFSFCCGGASCITQFGAICLNHQFPSLRNKSVNAPLVGVLAHADIIAGIPAAIVVTCWVVLRNTPYGWPFQDIIGAGFSAGCSGRCACRTSRSPPCCSR